MKLTQSVNSDFIQKQIQSLDQSILVSDDMIVQSYQSSDACFSIDISKWIQIDDNQARSEEKNHDQRQFLDSKETIQELEVAKRPSFDIGKTSQKEEQNATVSTGISSLVWTEIDNKKHKWNAADDMTQFKDQTTNVETVRLKSSFWSKIFICF
ncbi:unnamed protein product [Fraxinus pennsylvanica]|uniref:Uncharacterized protein n=1 Tax=Fraxinus pennsylvanica TaxID=56036 RepID=A0AAD2A7U1_9LAMI|nr:unnamed protein product [Fraxinus pennsylvanica]